MASRFLGKAVQGGSNKEAFKIVQTGDGCGMKVNNHSEDPSKKIDCAVKVK